jgi:hypothetical protein
MFIINTSTGTHGPTLATKASRGGPLYDSQTPPSLQARVGGVFLSFFYTRPTLATNASRWAALTSSDPTLAPNASRWAVLQNDSPPDPTLAPNASRWGHFLHFTTTDPPSLQTRVGGPFLHDISPMDPTLAPNASRWGLTLYIRPPELAQTMCVWANVVYFYFFYIS